MQWLEKIRPPKFLRYVYYRLYRFALNTNNSAPKTSVGVTLAFTHFLQLIFLMMLFASIFSFDLWEAVFEGVHSVVIAVVALGFLYITEFFYTFKDKHLDYLTEFETLEKKDYTYGTFLLLTYLVVSISLLFITAIFLIPLTSPHYQH